MSGLDTFTRDLLGKDLRFFHLLNKYLHYITKIDNHKVSTLRMHDTNVNRVVSDNKLTTRNIVRRVQHQRRIQKIKSNNPKMS